MQKRIQKIDVVWSMQKLRKKRKNNGKVRIQTALKFR